MRHKLIVSLLISVSFVLLISIDNSELERFYNKTNDFIKNNPNSPNLDDLYFYLAETNIVLNPDDFSKNAGLYKKVLEINPDFPDRDIILYNIGYNVFQNEMLLRDQRRLDFLEKEKVFNYPDSLKLTIYKMKESIDSFNELVMKHPKSDYYSLSLLYLGRIYFNIALDNPGNESFERAKEYFSILAEKGDQFNKNRGIFYRGWTNFLGGNFDASVDDFSQLLKKFEEDEALREKIFFEADAIDNIAYGLIEYDGTDFNKKSIAAEKAFTKVLPLLNEDYSKRVVEKAIALKLEYNAPMQAVDIYNAFLEVYPNINNAPSYIDSVIKIYQRYPERTRENENATIEILKQMKRLADNYHNKSSWYSENREKAQSDLIIIRSAYEFLEPRYYNEFVKSVIKDNYDNYMMLCNNYINYMEFNDQQANSLKRTMKQRMADITLSIAEKNKDLEFYKDANKRYKSYNAEYKDDRLYSANQDKAYYAAENIYFLLQDSLKSSFVANEKETLYGLYIQESIDYESVLEEREKKDNNEITRIILLRAEIRYKLGIFDEAISDYNRLIEKTSDKSRKRTAYTRIAEIYHERTMFVESENYYRKAFELSEGKEKKELESNIWASIKLEAEKNETSGDYFGSANEYMRLAKEINEEDKKVASLIKAIDMYKKAGEFDKAIDIYIQIAQIKQSQQDDLYVLASGWNLADSINNYERSIEIRELYINQYSKTNEAYLAKLQIINFYENAPYNDKARAAELFYDLYKNNSKYDLGNDKPEDILLKVIRLYTELNNEEKVITIMLEFEKTYPSNPNSGDFLVYIALYYEKNGDTKKYEELAKYIHKKDPDNNLYLKIAASKIREKKTLADNAFNSKKYEDMRTNINEIKNMDKEFKNNGLTLPLDDVYLQFKYYEDYIDYYNRVALLERRVNGNFLKVSESELIRVNVNTKWKEHLVSGKGRVKELQDKADSYKNEITEIIKEGDYFELDLQNRTRLIYLIAEVYEKAADVISHQLTEFLKISSQVNYDLKDAPEQRAAIKEGLTVQIKQLEIEQKRNAVTYYLFIYENYFINMNIENEWTLSSEKRLIELAVKKPVIKEQILINTEWMINNSEILKDDNTNSVLWDKVVTNTIPLGENDQNETFITILPDKYSLEVKYTINVACLPVKMVSNYLYSEPIQVSLNSSLISTDPIISSGFSYEDIEYSRFTQTSDSLSKGENVIKYVFARDSLASGSKLFKAEIILIYDKEAYENWSNSEMREFHTGRDWSVHYRNESGEIFLDSTNVDTALSYERSEENIIAQFSVPELETIIVKTNIDSTDISIVEFMESFDTAEEVLGAEIYIYSFTPYYIKINDSEAVNYNSVPEAFEKHDIMFNQGQNTIIIGSRLSDTGESRLAASIRYYIRRK